MSKEYVNFKDLPREKRINMVIANDLNSIANTIAHINKLTGLSPENIVQAALSVLKENAEKPTYHDYQPGDMISF